MTYASPGPKVGSKMPRAKPGEAACVDLTFVEQLMEKITDGSLGIPGGDSGGDHFGGSDDDRFGGGELVMLTAMGEMLVMTMTSITLSKHQCKWTVQLM